MLTQCGAHALDLPALATLLLFPAFPASGDHVVKSQVSTTSEIIDTSGWVGAEYQPSKSGNQDWLWHYDLYRSDIERELPLIKRAMAFTSFRVFLHSMIYFASPTKLLTILDDFLSICRKHDIKVGFVFFDDCWNHAGLNLSLASTCQPKKGGHNACWMASPQDNERISMGIEAFKPYVLDVINRFKGDARVLWWEIFNEPHVGPNDKYPQGNFSEALRHEAYQWSLAAKPTQPVLNCWNEASDSGAAVPITRTNTQLNDAHQYNVPWGGKQNAVFGNTSGLMKGGLVTEAGARWYQGNARDSGSPLTVIDWLTKLRADPAAPFVPGVMIDWEVMVSNSNTRWQWSARIGDPEPAIPWHQHVFPDGSPVSYTEAAAIRRYITGKDEFMFFDAFLADNNPASDEVFHRLREGAAFDVKAVFGNCLIEMAVWPSPKAIVTIDFKSGYTVHLNVAANVLELTRHGHSLQSFDTSKLENGILSSSTNPADHASWNMLRVLVRDTAASGTEISIWLNPMYHEAFQDGTFSLPGGPSKPTQALPPRINVLVKDKLPQGSISVSSSGGESLLDYLSVLPPVLLGDAGDSNAPSVHLI